MNETFLMNVMSCPSASKHEEFFRDCIQSWLKEIGVTNVKTDGKGNLYVTKGKPKNGEFYVCVCNHMDTVQHQQEKFADDHQRLEIKQNGDKIFCDGFGIGADDKAGCAIQMEMIRSCDVIKAVFFVEEEIGMLGSKNCDMSFFDDVCFLISFDSPEKNRAAHTSSGVKLFTDEVFNAYIKPIAEKHGVNNFRSEPYTDVSHLVKTLQIQGSNFGNGGYEAHSLTEYLKMSECMDAAVMGIELLNAIPKDKKLTIEYKEPDYSSWWKNRGISGSSWGNAFRKSDKSFSQDDLPGFDEDPIDVEFEDAGPASTKQEIDDFWSWIEKRKKES